MKKRGIRNKKYIKIVFSNRWLYTFIALGIILIIAVGVYAYGTSVPATFGHSYNELQPCSGTQILKMNGAGAWTCGDDAGGITTETDPQVGAVTASKWCIGDGSAVQCNQIAPSGGTPGWTIYTATGSSTCSSACNTAGGQCLAAYSVTYGLYTTCPYSSASVKCLCAKVV